MNTPTRRRQVPWQLRRTGFPTAWRLAAERRPGQAPVRIGLLDSGVDLSHPELRGLLEPGMNLISPSDPPADENGHGTHVAGIIAAASGLWWARWPWIPLRIVPVKIFDRTGIGKIGDIIAGIRWCCQHGIDIINLSFGTDTRTSPSLQRAVAEAERLGVLMIAAAGNDGRKGGVDYPGRYPEVVAVAASTRADRLAPFSSSGPEVDLIAPGAGVRSLAPGGGVARMSGTSMAAPHVSAAAALLLGMEPGLPPHTVRRRLAQSAEWLPTLPAHAQGAGLLRADRLLRARPAP